MRVTYILVEFGRQISKVIFLTPFKVIDVSECLGERVFGGFVIGFHLTAHIPVHVRYLVVNSFVYRGCARVCHMEHGLVLDQSILNVVHLANQQLNCFAHAFRNVLPQIRRYCI